MPTPFQSKELWNAGHSVRFSRNQVLVSCLEILLPRPLHFATICQAGLNADLNFSCEPSRGSTPGHGLRRLSPAPTLPCPLIMPGSIFGAILAQRQVGGPTPTSMACARGRLPHCCHFIHGISLLLSTTMVGSPLMNFYPMIYKVSRKGQMHVWWDCPHILIL